MILTPILSDSLTSFLAPLFVDAVGGTNMLLSGGLRGAKIHNVVVINKQPCGQKYSQQNSN